MRRQRIFGLMQLVLTFNTLLLVVVAVEVGVTLVLVAVLVVSELIKLVHNLEEDVLLKHLWLLQQELIL